MLVEDVLSSRLNIGRSPSGKAAGFGPAIRRFESFRPSLVSQSRLLNPSKCEIGAIAGPLLYFHSIANEP